TVAAVHVVGSLGRVEPTAGAYGGHGEGLTRRVLFGRDAGSVHQEACICELAGGGSVARHLHAFEEAFYVLEGSLVLEVAGQTEELDADDYGFVDRGVAHALRGGPARWFEVHAPQPGASIEDTVF